MDSPPLIDKTNQNQQKSEDKFKNIKSKFILQKIFDNLSKKNSLGLIKYNKSIQNRMDISINNFQEFLDKYSSIEIEIIPANDKFGKFINIEKGNEKYYHIYFNNNAEEIKTNKINEKDKVTRIIIVIDYQVKSLSSLFNTCECIKSINFKRFYRKDINNMNSMFYRCSALKELNFQNFNTNNVMNMGYMFCYCSSLKELNIFNFNTNNVTNMSYMFYGCSGLKDIDISNFNMSKVTNMRAMFTDCSEQLIGKIKEKYKNITEDAYVYDAD